VAKLFRRFGILTIITVIVLIFVGGIVRATGSGMGCPDWPKCFGMWVPPTHVDQLPQNYQQVFGAKLKGEVVFNPVKTWIEYVNRLLGVLTGFFIFLTFIFSFLAYRFSQPKIVILSFVSFLLVAFEGWLGSKVVSSELHPVLITVHMLVSLLLLGILIMVILKSYQIQFNRKKPEKLSAISFLLIISLILSIGQIIFGTQIREGIDLAQQALGYELRNEWIQSVKGKVVFHAILAFILLGLQLFIAKNIKKKDATDFVNKWVKFITFSIVISICSGGVLSLLGFPAFVQPIHLGFSVIIVSLQFVVYFLLEPDLI
jgi:heme a synthase